MFSAKFKKTVCNFERNAILKNSNGGRDDWRTCCETVATVVVTVNENLIVVTKQLVNSN